jgi:argininosuccinate synthase
MTGRIVLDYAGGSDVCRVVRLLTETYRADVVTLTLDLGQGRDLEEVRDRALAAGAARAHVLDVREAFAREFVLPVLRAGVSQEGRSVPLAVALGQSLVAQKLIEVVRIEEASAIAHGGVGQDQERLEANLAALNAAVRTIAVPPAASYSPEPQASMWGSFGIATRSSAKAPDTPASVDVAFDRGVPTGVNGVSMALVELIESLSTIGARHGVGRMAMGQGRLYHAPAAVILDAAYRALEAAVVPSELIRIQRDQAETYAELAYSGQWFSESRQVLDAFGATVLPMVRGIVRIKLFGGELLSPSPVELDVAAVSLS